MYVYLYILGLRGIKIVISFHHLGQVWSANLAFHRETLVHVQALDNRLVLFPSLLRDLLETSRHSSFCKLEITGNCNDRSLGHLAVGAGIVGGNKSDGESERTPLARTELIHYI